MDQDLKEFFEIAGTEVRSFKTMDKVYGDGSTHACCETCGHCIPCGDCDKHGCGELKKNINSSALLHNFHPTNKMNRLSTKFVEKKYGTTL